MGKKTGPGVKRKGRMEKGGRGKWSERDGDSENEMMFTNCHI